MKYWGGFGCSIASGVLNAIGSAMADPVTYDTIPGKIDLKADMQLDASGFISSFNATNIRGLNVPAEAINNANTADGHVGKGIWGLAEDPVVYIDTEDILSSYDHFVLLAKENGSSNTHFSNYETRIVYAFDPTSVKVNINRDLYPDIYDVNVTTTVGVYPDRIYGNTDTYRSFMMLDKRPSFRLTPGKTSGVMHLSASSNPRIWKVAPKDLLDTDPNAYETAANSKLIEQPGGNMRFYGRPHSEFFKTILVNPQVYVPYIKNGAVGDPIAPDFVVAVTVTFFTHPAEQRSADALPCIFSKIFIPKIELVDRNGMKNVSNTLKDYASKCKDGQTINALANDPAVKVYQTGGDQLVAKTLRMLQKIGL